MELSREGCLDNSSCAFSSSGCNFVPASDKAVIPFPTLSINRFT